MHESDSKSASNEKTNKKNLQKAIEFIDDKTIINPKEKVRYMKPA